MVLPVHVSWFYYVLPHYEEKLAITIHRRIKNSPYFTPILWLFVPRSLANLQHFLIGTFSFLENTLWLAAHMDSAGCLQISWCRTKLEAASSPQTMSVRGCSLLSSDHMVHLHLCKFFCSTHKCQDDTPNCGTKKKLTGW